MSYGTLPGVSKPVSRLVQGTATFFNPQDVADCYQMLDFSLEYGINTFDTAHCYGKERSVIFGNWLRERHTTDQVVILAKGAHPYNGRNRVTPEDIASDIDETMTWMQVEHLDLFVLHRDDPSVPVGPIVEALNQQKAAGKIGAFGGSNWTHQRVAEANSYAAANGLAPFAVSSPHYSLAEQIQEPWGNCHSIAGPGGEAARRWYTSSGVALFPWSSLSAGFFSGKYTKSDVSQLSEPRESLDGCLRCYASVDNFERLDRTKTLADAMGYTIPQVALAFVLLQPFNVHPLISCDGRAQFEANTAAVDIKLTEQELAYLDLKADTPD